MKYKSKKEIPVCGLKAVKALFDTEPEKVKRLFFDADKERRQKLGSACRYLARERKVYRQVSPEELAKAGETVHHGGVVAIIEVRPLQEPSAEDFRQWARRGQRTLLLDRIGNPHNLGAIARTAAFFGWGALVIGTGEREALFLNAATYRVPGSGRGESLNVSATAAVFMYRFSPQEVVERAGKKLR